METNWNPFNKIVGFASVMAPSHRTEVYDDYMRDANWKKLVGIGKCRDKAIQSKLIFC